MKYIFSIVLSFLVGYSFADGEKGYKEKQEMDSTSIEIYTMDYPFLRSCDSIYTEGFTPDEELHPWSFEYQFKEDSIPAYLDTTYAARLNKMDIKSPFSFQYNESVRNMILFYSIRRPGLIRKALKTKELYFPLFEEMLDKYQLPMELKYLAVVESALNPKAKSRVGAMGLWQFMPGTGRLYGLHINSKIDDRMNIYKATEAACQHFADLYARYHDWNLVLAAYNAGPGNVNKAIRRSGTSTDYWEIRRYLPRETQSYVPAFVAVNYLMQYYEAHNINLNNTSDNISYYETDTIYVNEKMTFSQIADWLEMDIKEVAALNTQYKKKYIPSSTTKKYVLTLPNNKIGEFILNKKLIISGLSRREYENQAIK
jgi:membrane-bound lytic murein transglycosylase D